MSKGRRTQTRGNKITASIGLILKNYFQLELNELNLDNQIFSQYFDKKHKGKTRRWSI